MFVTRLTEDRYNHTRCGVYVTQCPVGQIILPIQIANALKSYKNASWHLAITTAASWETISKKVTSNAAQAEGA